MGATLQGLMPGPSGNLSNTSAGFSEKYRVTIGPSDNPAVCMTASGLPAINSGHAVYATARVRSYSYQQVENTLEYIVTVEYSTPESSQDPEQETENNDPTLDAPKLIVSWEEREDIVTTGYGTGSGRDKGPRIETSAGEQPDTPVTTSNATLAFDVVVNTNSANAFTIATGYLNCINEGEFMGLASHAVRLVGVKPVTKYRNGSLYLEMTYSFRCMFPDWDWRQLDIGSYYIDPLTDAQTNFLSREGNPIQGLLNGSGNQLGSGADPVYRPPVQIYPSRDFSGLGLPGSGWVFA